MTKGDNYGNDQHAHMLGCAMAWFSGKMPEEWERLKHEPFESAALKMLNLMGADRFPAG